VKVWAFLTAAALWGGAAQGGQTMLADLPVVAPAQIVILGEVHDNPAHHLNQAALVARWTPAAVVFEMLTPEQAAANLDRTDATTLDASLGWNGTGWPDFVLYYPVFQALGTARIYGAAVPRDDVRRAMTNGAAAIFGDNASDFGLTTPLPDAEQTAREAGQMASHCNALPADMLPGMVEAQRLRDAAFARTALQALTDTGGPVVVITGTGHAHRNRGIPAALAQSGTSVFTLGQLEHDPGPDAPYDAWIITSPTPRGDPCAGFIPSQ
jgi:uncharacterized iron-regulated protein